MAVSWLRCRCASPAPAGPEDSGILCWYSPSALALSREMPANTPPAPGGRPQSHAAPNHYAVLLPILVLESQSTSASRSAIAIVLDSYSRAEWLA